MTTAEDDELTAPPAPPRVASKLQATRFSGPDLAKLQEVAELLNTDETDATRRAVRHSHWLLTLQSKGRTLFVRDDATGEVREVILLP